MKNNNKYGLQLTKNNVLDFEHGKKFKQNYYSADNRQIKIP